ncbi:MAG: carboxypeptidase M32 [Deltaproteobacteria bacterium]
MRRLKDLDELRVRLLEIDDLDSTASLARWDQMVCMPSGGGSARGRQLATLGRLAHEKLIDPEMGRLLDRLDHELHSLPPEDDDAALVRVTRRRYERSARVPASLVAALDEHAAKAYQVWTRARPANDFAAVRPHLEKLLDLSRERANCASEYESIADPLIALDDEGMKASSIRELFRVLRARLVPLVRAITSVPAVDTSCVRQGAAAEHQLAFARRVMKAFGYDFERGRLDLTPHPFSAKIAHDDVRATTRVRPDNLTECLFIALHEAGHGIYSQGGRAELEGTPLATPPSAGLDESQARLWENVVGRSRGFWEHFYPQLQREFPQQLGAVALDTFHRAINSVERSLLRGQADEVTYNLHVMLRFDLEIDLLEGRLEVKDLARAWRERFEADFGIPVPDDARGVLQDVHWYSGRIGGVFQGYTLGNLMSAQLYAGAIAAHPEIPEQIANGKFETLRYWLRDNVYVHGAKFTANEVMRRATGSDVSIEPYVEYLNRKYRPLYALDAR